MTRIFISHASTDRGFVTTTLNAILNAISVEPWFAEDKIDPAEDWTGAIGLALESAEWFMVVMSSAAVQSDWVKHEVTWALENRKGRVIPVRIDDCDPSHIDDALLRIQQIDFTRDSQDATMRLAKVLVDAEYLSRSKRSFVESLLVEVTRAGSFLTSGDAAVHLSDGCGQILGLTKKSCAWGELQTRAEDERGKGTFWIKEIRDVISDVLADKPPRVMTSTFRGRGDKVRGQIFRPQLHHLRSSDSVYVFCFDICEVLVPELVRGPELSGELFFLLYIVSRVRWEVLEPFFVKPVLQEHRDATALDDDERYRLINQISGSLRVIELELERHNKLEEVIVTEQFNAEDRDALLQMLEERGVLRTKITAAIERKSYDDLIAELEKGLALNIKATALLAKKFSDLTANDQVKVEQMLMQRKFAEV